MIQSLISISMLIFLNLATLVGYCRPTLYENFILYETDGTAEFALGGFILSGEENFRHEYGHHLQEKILKEMYLPVVGTASFVGHLLCKTAEDYLIIPTEAWADELGGVKRE